MTASAYLMRQTSKAQRLVRPLLTIVQGLQLGPINSTQSKGAPTKRSVQLVPSSERRTDEDCLIHESGRNNALASMAGTMRRKGMSTAAIDAALQAENRSRCVPPLDINEVSGIATSIAKYPPDKSTDILKTLTDTANADRFGNRHKTSVKYVVGSGWMQWNNLCWKRDQVGAIVELAKDVARDIYDEGVALEDDVARFAISRHAKSSLQANKIKAMVELAKSLPALTTEAGLLDAHDMLLGVANGTIDLRMGNLRAPSRDELLTRHSPVAFDPKATCPKFEHFIDQVTRHDAALASYLQRVVGYTLTGRTDEQCLFFLYGHGANGKSTFLNVIKDLLGVELARQTPSETLMTRHSTATNDIARLHSVRMVIANEIEDGSLLAESLVKQMTGGEALTGRFHYQEFFEFTPKFKLFIAGNHKPVIRGRDEGIWRRIRLIPFLATFPPDQRDKHLQEKLRAELPGILNWALKGCLAHLESGLAPPQVVTDAVDSYRKEMDVIGVWRSECCAVGSAFECKAGEAYRSYKDWAVENGYKPMAAGTFSRDLADRHNKIIRNDGNYFLGLKRSLT